MLRYERNSSHPSQKYARHLASNYPLKKPPSTLQNRGPRHRRSRTANHKTEFLEIYVFFREIKFNEICIH